MPTSVKAKTAAKKACGQSASPPRRNHHRSPPAWPTYLKERAPAEDIAAYDGAVLDAGGAVRG